MSRLRTRGYIAWHRLRNRLMDVRAVLAGACNWSTWNEAKGDHGGGYAHWRCGRRRGHAGDHRFNNYVWPEPGHRTVFSPLPVGNSDEVIPFRRLAGGRHMIDTRRQSRLREQRAEIARAVRAAERIGR